MNIFVILKSHWFETLLRWVFPLLVVLILCLCFNSIEYREITPEGVIKEFILRK